LDDLWQQYPESDAQALVPRTLDKRLPGEWVEKCYIPIKPLTKSDLQSIHPKLRVFFEPIKHHHYVIGADPAEGNPQSDFSALTILDMFNAEEVCSLNARIEPTLFTEIVMKLAAKYNNASILPERNNHGHVMIALITQSPDRHFDLLAGLDGHAGWHTNAKSKAEMYSTSAEVFKTKATVVHSEETFFQLCGVDGSTLRAPDGEYDDLATSYALALQALTAPVATSFAYSYVGRSLPVKRDRRFEKSGVVYQ